MTFSFVFFLCSSSFLFFTVRRFVKIDQIENSFFDETFYLVVVRSPNGVKQFTNLSQFDGIRCDEHFRVFVFRSKFNGRTSAKPKRKTSFVFVFVRKMFSSMSAEIVETRKSRSFVNFCERQDRIRFRKINFFTSRHSFTDLSSRSHVEKHRK